MQAVEITSFGAPNVLRLGQRPDAVAGVGEVLIKVAASGINRPDVLQRMGMYPVPPGASDLPGLEVAGTIVGGDKVAIQAAGFNLGDHVCALVAGGGYAQLCAAPVGQCLPVPKGMSDLEAATLPETFFTVWSNLFDRARLQQGETVLIQGGTSGIGVTAIQMAKALGDGVSTPATRVIATAGSDEKCAACLKLGADYAINYKTHDFVQEVKRITGAVDAVGQGSLLSNASVKGVNVILDMVAGDYVAREIDCLAEDGRLVIIAVQGGVDAKFNAGLVLRRRLQITGSTLRPRPVVFKTQIAQALRKNVWPLIEAGKIKTVIHSVFSPQDAAAAHALMETNQHIGKIVLDWSKV
jgi:NADPH:quinone reductase